MKPCTNIILIALFAVVSGIPSIKQSVETAAGETTPTDVQTIPLDIFCVDCSYVCEILQEQVNDPTISFTEAYIAELNHDLCYSGDDKIIDDDDAFCYDRGDIDAIFNTKVNQVEGNEEVYHELCENETPEP